MSGAVEQIELLKLAKIELGYDKVITLLPKPFRLYLSDHDTGCQADIVAQADGYETISVWEGSKWYSAHYEFNDRNKTFGLKHEFARPTIEKFFATLAELISERAKQRASSQLSQKAEKEVQREAALDFYASMVADGDNAG